jgi:sugar phosphate isomerase/epimerase
VEQNKHLMIGITQGRLSLSESKLQCFPKNPLAEFPIARNAKYKFIEFFVERNINKKNPIWSNIGIKNYIKSAKVNNLCIYSFCDDYYINHNLGERKTLDYALRVLKRVQRLKIKKYIIPLFGKSFLRPHNQQNIIRHISRIARICGNYRIELLLESNMSPQKFEEIKEKISCKNCFFLFDTGNRCVLKRSFYHDLKLFGKNIRHIHLKDKNIFKKNVIIGKGTINFDLFFFYLKKIGYKGSFTIESQRGSDILRQAKKNFNFFNKLINKNNL